MYYLQSRWKLSGNRLQYYGMRALPNLNKNIIKVTRGQAAILECLPKELTKNELKKLKKLVFEGIVTTAPRKIPASPAEAVFCKKCCANDFIIPGIEFDENGLCPMCATSELTKKLKSVVPTVKEIKPSKKSRFDAAVFYTGGKDSTYLLYYLAKVKKLKVLALTWEIEFISDSAKKSIESAKKYFENVEFVSRKLSRGDMRKIYRKLYALNENT